MEVCQDYYGMPPPPVGFGQPLHLSKGDIVELTRADPDLSWWEVIFQPAASLYHSPTTSPPVSTKIAEFHLDSFGPSDIQLLHDKSGFSLNLLFILCGILQYSIFRSHFRFIDSRRICKKATLKCCMFNHPSHKHTSCIQQRGKCFFLLIYKVI